MNMKVINISLTILILLSAFSCWKIDKQQDINISSEKNIDSISVDLTSKNNNSLLEDVFIWSTNKVLETKYSVTNIVDGDTIDIFYNWKSTRLRLIWIDTPESTSLRTGYIECYWKEATEYIKQILNWKEITIEFDDSQEDIDVYWRMLVYIFLEGENINNKMIEEWYAYEYTYNKPYKYIETFKQSEIEAKNTEIGLWNINTCNWKKVISNTSKNNIIISEEINNNCNIKWNISYSSNEKIYHKPWCPDYDRTVINTSKWERMFCSEKDAIFAWWRKAKNCY